MQVYVVQQKRNNRRFRATKGGYTTLKSKVRTYGIDSPKISFNWKLERILELSLDSDGVVVLPH